MIAPVQTKAEHYIKMQGENVPINLAACGVKCITCNQYYPQDKFQQHLNLHVNPQFISTSPAINNISPTKLNLAFLAEDPEKVQDIWIKSVLPEQLPRPETQRKKVAKPSGQVSNLRVNEIFQGINALGADCKNDLFSNLGDTIDQSSQGVQQLNVIQNIKLNRISNPINKKQIKLYTNENKKTKNYDSTNLEPKMLKTQRTQDSDGYNVSRAPSSNIQEQGGIGGIGGVGMKLLGAPKQRAHQYMINSRAKNPVNPLKISTFSKNQPASLSVPHDWKQRSRSTVIDGTSYVGREGAHDHSCPCCGGFYCSYCKSSVPPKYRPVPDEDGNYHFHPDQNQRSVTAFYRDHYYPRQDRSVCTHCSKQLGHSRMNYQQPSNGNSRRREEDIL